MKAMHESHARSSVPLATTRVYEARVQLMQVSSRSRDAPFFLATDGFGTVTAYIHLKPLHGGRRIYALGSLFLDNPEEYTCSVPEIAAIFIRSIREIQSHGPYLIGGSSAGAVHAYDVAYQLTVTGDKVDKLVLMGMRVPHSVPDAEEVTMAFVEKTGAFTDITRTDSLLQGLSEQQKIHSTSTVRALIRYDPSPFQESDRPYETHLIWKTKGLNESESPEERDECSTGRAAMIPVNGDPAAKMSKKDYEIEPKSWFVPKRYDFGTNGWEDFLGPKIALYKVETGK